MTAETHCQICGRAIKTTFGYCGSTRRSDQVIAHHGYQRPGLGTQTASCPGARWRPYEVAADAIPPVLAAEAGVAERAEARLAEMLKNPPATLDHQPTRCGRPAGPLEVYFRPEDYDVNGEGAYTPGTYDAVFKHQKWAARRAAKEAREVIKFLEKRLADWVAAAPERRGVIPAEELS